MGEERNQQNQHQHTLLTNIPRKNSEKEKKENENLNNPPTDLLLDNYLTYINICLMPHLSRKHLPEDTRKLINNALFWTFSSLKGKEIDYIFDSLLTPTERLMLAKRLGILFLVKENKLDSTISEILKVSLPTVARIRLQHKLISSESSNFFFRKLSNWQEFTLFKNVMRNLGFQALKTFSRGMAGKI